MITKTNPKEKPEEKKESQSTKLQPTKESEAKKKHPSKKRKLEPVPTFVAAPISELGLQTAVQGRDVDYIKHCLLNGASARNIDFSKPVEGDLSLLFAAAQKGNESAALLMLNGIVNLEERHELDFLPDQKQEICSLIDLAIKHDMDRLFMALLERNADKYSRYKNELWLPAAYCGASRIMKCLIDNRLYVADPTDPDIGIPITADGRSALLVALQRVCFARNPRPYLAFIELLLEKFPQLIELANPHNSKYFMNESISFFLRFNGIKQDCLKNMQKIDDLRINKEDGKKESSEKRIREYQENLRRLGGQLYSLEKEIVKELKKQKKSTHEKHPILTEVLDQIDEILMRMGTYESKNNYSIVEIGESKNNYSIVKAGRKLVSDPIPQSMEIEEGEEEEEQENGDTATRIKPFILRRH